MELATPLTNYVGPEPNIEEVVRAIREYGATLAELAGQGIYHRDVKPPNLYWYNDLFAIGDFGIADFPDKRGLTRTGEEARAGKLSGARND